MLNEWFVHGKSAKVGNTKVHPSTTFWVNTLYVIGFVYAYCVFLQASWTLILMIVGPLIALKLIPWYLHSRLYPYRNGLVQCHIARACERSSIWKRKDRIKILDFGCGQGDSAAMLRNIFGKDANITSIDVYRSERWVGGIADEDHRVIYDGDKLPFNDKEFDLAIAGQVLHHVPDNRNSVEEVSRTCKTFLIVEDLVKHGTFQAQFCYFWDSFWNWDFFVGPPHTNREDAEWTKLLADSGMKVTYRHYTSLAFAPKAFEKEPGPIFSKSLLCNVVYVAES